MDLLFKINDFFDDYAKAMESFNAKRLAYCYELPCSFLSDDAVTAYTDATQLEGFFTKGLAFYRQNGIVNVKPEVWSKERLTDTIVKVKMNWHYYNENEVFLYSCAYYYLLKVNSSNQLKINAAISVNEKEKVEEWLNHTSTNAEVTSL